MSEWSKWKVLDIETDGQPWDGRLLCVGWGEKAYVEGDVGYAEMLRELADETVAKVVFTKYDHKWLRLHGIEVNGPIIDVQVMAWAVNERTPLDLEWCANRYCKIVMDKRIVQRGGVVMFKRDDDVLVPIGEAPIEQMRRYNEGDLTATARLFQELSRLLRFDNLGAYYERDAFPFTSTLLDMECNGMPVNSAGAAALWEELGDKIEHITDGLYVAADLPAEFNLNSSKQLGQFLYEDEFDVKRRVRITPEQRTQQKKFFETWGTYEDMDGMAIDKVGRDYAYGRVRVQGLGFKVPAYTEGGQPVTDAPTLRITFGDNAWIQKYMEQAQLVTIRTFLNTMATKTVDGRLYGNFNQTGTKTGRLSSSGPNLQNIPSRGPLGRAVRELFVPEPGWKFVHGDYSQLEPRLMAHFSGDPVLMSIYENDEDIYLTTAMRVFNCSLEEARQYRNAMKTYVLALGYGSGAKTLRTQLAQAGQFFPLHEVKDTLEQLKRVYKVFFEWKEEVIFDALNEGYVETLAGHRRRFGGTARSANWKAQGADERQAVNAVIQGSAGDIVARAMMQVNSIDEARLLVQVHDELLLEFPEDVEPDLQLIQTMCELGHGFELKVPLSFEPRVIGSWAEGKD